MSAGTTSSVWGVFHVQLSQIFTKAGALLFYRISIVLFLIILT
jgi:hypothetical protein